jgi:hypothetical protein
MIGQYLTLAQDLTLAQYFTLAIFHDDPIFHDDHNFSQWCFIVRSNICLCAIFPDLSNISGRTYAKWKEKYSRRTSHHSGKYKISLVIVII